jgi:uncharacterized protein (UPF0335 family)
MERYRNCKTRTQHGNCIFHRWIDEDGEVYGLVETKDGRMKAMPWKWIYFTDSEEYFNMKGKEVMKTELSCLIDELERFEEEIISEYCPAMSDVLNCDKFCVGDDCIIVRTANALRKVVKDER